MEPHSVPQDILNAEFKLFGAFSLSQFVKMVIGCLIGLFFFLVIPNQFFIIKLPLSIGPVVIGIGIALVPRFAVKFDNYVKAVFISPRYVWVKQDPHLDVLSSSRSAALRKKAQGKSKKSSHSDPGDIDLEEISLDKLLAAREKTPELRSRVSATPRDALDNTSREQNLDRVYDNLYEKEKQQIVQNQAQRQTQIQQNVQRQFIQNQSEQQRKIDKSVQFNSPKEIQNKIAELKKKLSGLVKDQRYREKEAEILGEINDLYHELKMLGIESVNSTLQQTQTVQVQQKPTEPSKSVDSPKQITDFQGAPPERQGQIVYGIVVDKKGEPIPNAEVFFDLKDSSKDTYVSTDSQGRFNSNVAIAPGTYDIQITHPEHKFHTYTITVTDQKLPAYRLRAR